MFYYQASSFAQTRYIIKLRDKGNNSFSLNAPEQFLSQRSIDRRNAYGISIDSTDLPVTSSYLDSIRMSGNVSVLNVSKWLNLVCIKTLDAAALTKINSFPFVISSTPFAARAARPSSKTNTELTEQMDVALSTQNLNDYYNYGQAYNQIHLNNGEFLHNLGFLGAEMQMAIIDAGFFHYKTLATFDSVRNNDQILGTWDFVNNEESVNEDYLHGMQCFSTIAANLPGTFVGTAPKAAYYLYRSEDAASETAIEELNWVAAAEKADSAGVNIISSSLGYTTFDGNLLNHTYADMNGDISICAKATDIAAKKGILAVIAIGNDGQRGWHYLSTPSDADSCLTVGAVDINRQVAAFSSYGPSSDGQIKPDIAALGLSATIANSVTGLPEFGNGTSFATPIVAGIATCLWQAFPEVNNMAIIDVLRRSADRYTTPDNRTGYGITDAKKAFVGLIKQLHTQQVMHNKCAVNISWTAKASNNMSFDIERKLPTEISYSTIITKNVSGTFSSKQFNFKDDLSFIDIPSLVKYRIKMTIGTDTSFYLDSASINYTEQCDTYIFTGDGNWDVAANWSNNTIPPDSLPAGSKIIIDPLFNGKCILNISQYVSSGSILIVNASKDLIIEGDLKIEDD